MGPLSPFHVPAIRGHAMVGNLSSLYVGEMIANFAFFACPW